MNAVAFSSDGGLLASASADRTVRLWNPNTRALLRGLPVKAGTVPLRQFISVAFSPEGDLLAAGNENGSVYVWNPRTRQQTATLTLPTDDGAYGLAFTQNGPRLAVAYQSGVVAIWDVLVKRSVKQLAYGPRTEMQAAFQVAYSASMPGLLAATYGDGVTRLWDTVSDKPLRQLQLSVQAGPALSVALSRDGQTVAGAGSDGTIRLWRTRDGASRGTPLVGHSGPVNGLVFSPDDSRLFSVGDDQQILEWNPDVFTDPDKQLCEGLEAISLASWKEYLPDETPPSRTCAVPTPVANQ
ncbi:WD40 repeat domain-containing protein [Plantactinospora sp. S1510]|uniref:WD40 repeat domain-containing protein n=1 Tax=Plantactinospora alkalitolerans TaxID=2789879 RepID=A0ABS0GP24_9ACTN|nr:WD40 repeat domain-containing protein [Plantactinospora alkalitolerans]